MEYHPKLNVDFINGLVFFKHLQVYCPLIEIFVYMLYLLKTKCNDEEFKKILVENSYSDCLIIYKKLSSLKSDSQKIYEFLEIINGFGMGEIKLDYKKNSKYYFKSYNLKMSLVYKKLFKNYPDVVLEYLIVGFLKNFFEIFFEKEINLKFNNYGFIYYTIELEVKNKSKKRKQEELKYIIPKEKYPTSSQVKKFCVGDFVLFEKGEIKFWEAYSLNLLVYFVISLFDIMSKKNLTEDLLALGEVQAYNGLESQKKLFGFINSLFYNCMWKGEIIGMGKVIQTKNTLFLFNNFKKLGKEKNLDVDLFCSYIEKIMFVTYLFTNKNSCTFTKENTSKFRIKFQKINPELSKKAKEIISILFFAKTIN